MHPDGLEDLPAAECLRPMATVPAGRIAYTRQAMPAVEPVNFTLDDGAVVFRTARGGKLAAATLRAVVAFQADDPDPVTRSGWSVTVVGLAQEVTEPAEVARLDRPGLETWAPGTRDHFIRVMHEVVTGRRLHPARG